MPNVRVRTFDAPLRLEAAFALALCQLALGCSVYRSPPIGRDLAPGSVIRIESSTPMTLGTLDAVRGGRSTCKVEWLEGELHQSLADTLLLRRVNYFLESRERNAARGQSSCHRMDGAAMLVRTPDSNAWERQNSRRRTAVVIIGAATLVASIAAFLSPLTGAWYEFPTSR